MRKKLIIILLVIISVLLITNPSTDNFKNYLGTKGYILTPSDYVYDVRYGRDYYCGLFSIYEYRIHESGTNYFKKTKFIGLFNNFIEKGNSLEVVK